MVRKERVEMPYSRMRNSVVQKLRTKKYVDDVETIGHGVQKRLVVTLAYTSDGKHRVRDVKRISTPGRRIYLGVRDIKPVKNNYGIILLSTPKGILTGDEARKEHVGGEALFKIW